MKKKLPYKNEVTRRGQNLPDFNIFWKSEKAESRQEDDSSDSQILAIILLAVFAWGAGGQLAWMQGKYHVSILCIVMGAVFYWLYKNRKEVK